MKRTIKNAIQIVQILRESDGAAAADTALVAFIALFRLEDRNFDPAEFRRLVRIEQEIRLVQL